MAAPRTKSPHYREERIARPPAFPFEGHQTDSAFTRTINGRERSRSNGCSANVPETVEAMTVGEGRPSAGKTVARYVAAATSVGLHRDEPPPTEISGQWPSVFRMRGGGERPYPSASQYSRLGDTRR